MVGFSRNPGDRDQLLEQRTRDLQGRTGQLRGSTLESFLSDYEEQGRPYPWTIADDAAPEMEPGIAVCGGRAVLAPGLPAVHAAASVGVELTWRTLHVLGVVDSSDTGQCQQAMLGHMQREAGFTTRDVRNLEAKIRSIERTETKRTGEAGLPPPPPLEEAALPGGWTKKKVGEASTLYISPTGAIVHTLQQVRPT